MKYLAKTFVETIPDGSPVELVFNAVAWKEGYRFFGCSRDLSKAMIRPKKNNSAYTSGSATIHYPNREYEEDKIIRKNPTWEKCI